MRIHCGVRTVECLDGGYSWTYVSNKLWTAERTHKGAHIKLRKCELDG